MADNDDFGFVPDQADEFGFVAEDDGLGFVADEPSSEGFLSPSAKAFLSSTVDTAIPLYRHAEALNQQRVGESLNNPVTYQEALGSVNKGMEETAQADPMADFAGKGLGFGISAAADLPINMAGAAAIRPAFSAATREIERQGLTRSAQQAASWAETELPQLLMLGAQAGATTALVEQPKTWKEALEIGRDAASISTLLGLGINGSLAATKAGARGVDNFLMKKSRAAHAEQVGLAEKGLKLAQEDASLKTKALTDLEIRQANEQDAIASQIQQAERSQLNQIRSAERINKQVGGLEGSINQVQDDLVNTQSHMARIETMMRQQDQIEQRVVQLPNRINQSIDLHLEEAKKAYDARLAPLAQTPVEIADVKQNAFARLDSVKDFTPEQTEAKEIVRKLFTSVDDKTVGPVSAGDLRTLISEVQSVIYDPNFLKRAPRKSELYKAAREFETGLRAKLNALDETGELGREGRVINSLIEARHGADGFDDFSPSDVNYFKNVANNPRDPGLIKRLEAFERHLLPKSEIEARYGKSAAKEAGIADDVAQDPAVKARLESLRDVMHLEINAATKDYATLQNAKKQYPTLQTKASSLESKKILLENSLEARRLSAEKASRQLANTEDRLNQTKGKQKGLKDLQQADKETAALAAKRAELAVQKQQTGLAQLVEDAPRNSLELLLPPQLRIALRLKREIDPKDLKQMIANPKTAATVGALRALKNETLIRTPSAFIDLENSPSDEELQRDLKQ